MQKLNIKLFFIIILFVGNIITVNAQQLSLTQKTACTNDTVRVPLNYSSINALVSLTVVVSYDTAVLNYIGLGNVNSLTSALVGNVPVNGTYAWKLTLTWYSPTSINLVSGKLCDLVFIYKGGNSNLTILPSYPDLELVNSSFNNINTTVVNGGVSSTVITSQPANASTCEGTTTAVSLSTATGTTSLWQTKSGTTWSNVQNGTSYSGASTTSLQVLLAPYTLNNALYRCKVTGTCTDYSKPSTLTVYQKPVVVISHDTSVCKGSPVIITANGSTGYSPLSYSWNNGLGTGISKTVSPLLNTSYQLTVTDGRNCTATSTVNVSTLTIASNAGTITGLNSVCQQQSNVSYSIPTFANASAYSWSLPSGVSGSSTSNSIVVNYSNIATSGNLKIKVTNICGDTTFSTQAINVNPLPAIAGLINGLTDVNQGQTSIVYTVPLIANATSYVWSLPSGMLGTSTTNSITLSANQQAYSGNINVKGSNSCGLGLSSTLFIKIPKKLVLKIFIEGFYDKNLNAMIKTQDAESDHFGGDTTDIITVEIAETSGSNATLDTLITALKTSGLTSTIIVPGQYTASYYIIVKHRNAIETWSALPISFNTDSVYYNFTNASSKALGDNLKELNQGVYGIYSGDLTGAIGIKDGTVNIWDLNEVFDAMNDVTGEFNTGYLKYDVTGNGNVDIYDMQIIFDNMNAGIVVFSPLTIK